MGPHVVPDVATGIFARAGDFGADLIVMTSHRESSPSATYIGGVAAHLAPEATSPQPMSGRRVPYRTTP